jgi:hypothetical protein
MPLRITTVGREKTVGGLVKSLLGAKSSKELQERATEALLRANPALAEEGGVRAGMPVIVPDLGRSDDDTPAAAAEDAPPHGTPLEIALMAARDQLGSGIDAAAAAVKAQAKAIRSTKTQKAVLAAHPELNKDQLEAMAAAEEQEADRLAALVQEFRARIDRAIEGMAPS